MARGHEASGWGGNGRGGSVARVVEALRSDGPSSQAALARRTRLSPATINNIVKELRGEGAAEVRRVNGRESVVSLVSSHGAVISVQVNVTSLHAAVFDFAHRARHDVTIPLREAESEGGSPEAVIDMVRSLVADAGLGTADVTGLAVGMQAPIARPTGVVTSWARLQLPRWKDVVIADRLGGELGVPVVVENDANLAALAEWTWGAGQGTDTFLYVLCSERVGGGLILEGRIHHGGDGLAGEIGHMVLEQGGPVCFCGNRGCLTTFVAERPILAALEAAGGATGSLAGVIDAARGGDPASSRVLFEAGRHLGRAFANAAKLVAPSVIAVGGLLGSAGSLVFGGLDSSVEINSLRTVAPSLSVEVARLGADATLLGGVAAAMDHLGNGLSALPEWMKATGPARSFTS
ncbi:ROK family transcriptional regulator [Amycolatopsis acidicola]|uniref:ROK family transcriptional regulator n=1 Tax=Amycolatopsis acidicola TaxID=2596893 RepID=A0A5N0VLD9_9PSEU|nr:ROK family transcriptional regulator [Amycolatopsis acidicola]KAA9165542.1 ROK family transcriptional regulator [Amycolatopsis acidicola]